MAAFCDAFPDCTLWTGARYEWILMGGRDFRHRAAAQHVARLWERPQSAARIVASGFEHPAQVGAAFLAGAEHLRRWTADAAPVTDDHPKRMATASAIEEPRDQYARLLDVRAAAANFRGSQWIAAHWPKEFVDLALQFYQVQPIMNGDLPTAPAQRLELLDALLRQTKLTMPVLWLLESDMTAQQIVARQVAAAGGAHKPAHAYTLGALSLSGGDYGGAAALFAEAAEQDAKLVGGLAAYAACRAGLPAKAHAAKGADLLPPALRCWN